MAEMLGLDIGSHSIKLVGLKITSGETFLTHVGIKEIPQGKAADREGALSEVLKALLEEVGIKSRKVRLTVSGSGVNIQRIRVPWMPKAELKEAVRWEIKGRLPFPVETARIDLHILGEAIEDKVKKLDLIVVACPNDLIQQTLSVAQGAGLQPIHLSVGPFALWDAFLAWGQVKEEEEVALIDFGADQTGIHFFRGETLQFSREITPAGADITRSIVDGMGSGEETGILYERAERIKKALGISSEGSQESMPDESIDLSKIVFYMRPVLERMAAEIGRSLDYYKHEFFVDRMDRILLTGGGAHLKNLSSYLADHLQVPVVHFNPLKEMPFDSNKIPARRRAGIVQILDQTGSQFSVAAGVALPQPKRIELLAAKEPLITKARVVESIPVLAPLVALLAFIGIIWNMSGQLISLKNERDAKVAKVAQMETLRAKLTPLKEKEKRLKEELSLFPSSAFVSLPYEELLIETSHMMPDNTTLTLLSVAQGKGAKTNSAKGETQGDEEKELHLAGIAFGSDIQCLTALAQMIEGLEKSQLFRDAKLVSADENKHYNRPGVEFEIVCKIVPNIPSGAKGDLEKLGRKGL